MITIDDSGAPRKLEVSGQSYFTFEQLIIKVPDISQEQSLLFYLNVFNRLMQPGKTKGNGSLLHSRTRVPCFLEQHADNRRLLLQCVPRKLTYGSFSVL